MNLTFGSVCSGIGAPEVAWTPLGWRPQWFAEIAPFPSSVLAYHWPRVPNLGDMTKLAAYVRVGIVSAPDVLVGGTPCQAFSVAGLRAGLADPRGQLTLAYVDLANAIDEKRPAGDECVVVWENVPGVLSDKSNAFGCVLGLLAGEDDALVPPGTRWPNAGVVYGPQRAIAWRVLDAQYFGVAQRRRRVFVVASARAGFDPGKLLFDNEGLRRDSPPSRRSREEIAGGFEIGPSGGRFTDVAPTLDCRAKNGPIQNQLGAGVLESIAFGGNRTSGPLDISPALLAQSGFKYDFESEALIVSTLDASYARLQGCSGQDANHGHSHLVPTAYAIQAGALRTNPNSGPDGVGVQEGLAYTLVARAEVQAVAAHMPDTVGALCAHSYTGGMGGGRPEGAVAGHVWPVLGFHVNAQPDQMRFDPNTAASLTCSQNAGVLQQLQYRWRVRRLMPHECERLQGFPDGHTLVPHRGKPAADGPRYKAIGNSMCTLVMRWLGERVELALAPQRLAA